MRRTKRWEELWRRGVGADLGVDEDRVGGQIRVDEPGILVQELESLADLQQALLDLELVDLELAPPPHAVGILGDVATGAASDAGAGPLLAIFLL